MGMGSFCTPVRCLLDQSFESSSKLWFALNSTVTFCLIVFQPFASEVLIAKVKSSSAEGIWCMLFLEYFDPPFSSPTRS